MNYIERKSLDLACIFGLLLYRHFKEKVRQQSKKDEAKWTLLVRKVMEAKNLSNHFPARFSGSS